MRIDQARKHDGIVDGVQFETRAELDTGNSGDKVAKRSVANIPRVRRASGCSRVFGRMSHGREKPPASRAQHGYRTGNRFERAGPGAHGSGNPRWTIHAALL